jgi:hypothetical protein
MSIGDDFNPLLMAMLKIVMAVIPAHAGFTQGFVQGEAGVQAVPLAFAPGVDINLLVITDRLQDALRLSDLTVFSDTVLNNNGLAGGQWMTIAIKKGELWRSHEGPRLETKGQ